LLACLLACLLVCLLACLLAMWLMMMMMMMMVVVMKKERRDSALDRSIDPVQPHSELNRHHQQPTTVEGMENCLWPYMKTSQRASEINATIYVSSREMIGNSRREKNYHQFFCGFTCHQIGNCWLAMLGERDRPAST